MVRLFIVTVILSLLGLSCYNADDRDIDVMTLNIRYDNPFDGVNAWPKRAHIIAGFVNSRMPDLLGMQEVLWHQYQYLDSALTGYGSVAAGRDDGLFAGEACAVFYRLERFSFIDEGTFWLSATPGVPGSVGWGAALTRIATWVKLYDEVISDTLLFFNTHFDHISDSARLMSSGVLLGMVAQLSGENRFIITGDFNARPESLAIARMKEGDLAVDSYMVSETPPKGEMNSFNNWKDEPGDERIDYIWIRSGMKVLTHETLRIKENGVFISDHWPVMARVRYK